MQKRLNVSISTEAHKVIERYKLDNDLITKEEALEKILFEFKEAKNGKSK